MTAPTPSPLRAFQETAGAYFLPYGPGGDASSVEVVESFGEYEAEYAAIRKGVGILDTPHRGVIEVRGGDRLAFLHHLVTHDTKGLTPGTARRAFFLTKAGRIAADVVVLHEAEATWLAVDAFDAARVARELTAYIFAEDVSLADASGRFAAWSLHGPGGAALLESAGAPPLGAVGAWEVRRTEAAGTPVLLYRRDETGSPGLHLIVPREAAAAFYARLAAAVGGLRPAPRGGESGGGRLRGRGIGWLAYNTARIEAGTPIYHIDFGPDSLPHETGVLDDAVSFTKGCYLGQEIVARMQHLGHPKRTLVRLTMPDARLPVAGTPVTAEVEADGVATGPVVGAVTSSTGSPLAGGHAVAIAMVKWGHHRPGGSVTVPAEGAVVPARVEALKPGVSPLPSP